MEETMVKLSETKSVNTSPEDMQGNAQENQTKEQSISETDASKNQTKELSISETDDSNRIPSESSEGEPITGSEAKEEQTDMLVSKLEEYVVQSEGSKETDEEVVIPADTTKPTSVQPEDSEETRSVPVDIPASSENSLQNTANPANVGNDKKRSERSASTTPPQVMRPSENYGAQPLLLSLPIDSLHTVASYLLPSEWESVGECNKGASRICKEIFRRVRMHGFRCATEVVTAWVSWFDCDRHGLFPFSWGLTYLPLSSIPL
jgi:hypothetical protein